MYLGALADAMRIPYSEVMKQKHVIILVSIVLMAVSCATGGFTKPENSKDLQPASAAQDRPQTQKPPAADSKTDTAVIPSESPAAATPAYATPLAAAVLAELNFVRTNPRKYAEEVLVPRRSLFNGNIYAEPGKIPLETQEGLAPLDECITVLRSTAAVGSLSLEKGLCLAAQWLADDQARTGGVGHVGSDGSALATRISRYGVWGITCGENCAYGSKTAREIVAQLLIDDGVPNRGHRINILRKEFQKVGFGFSDKDKAPYNAVAVMDFAGSYTSK